MQAQLDRALTLGEAIESHGSSMVDLGNRMEVHGEALLVIGERIAERGGEIAAALPMLERARLDGDPARGNRGAARPGARPSCPAAGAARPRARRVERRTPRRM